MGYFVVCIRGAHVFHECSLVTIVHDTRNETLDKVAKLISKKYNLEVYDFTYRYGVHVAWTSDKDVKVFIEHVFDL